MGSDAGRRAGAERLADAARLLPVVLFAALVPLLLRLPLPWLAERLRRAGPRPGRPPTPVAAIVDDVRTAIRAGHPVVRHGCLTRGLTLLYFLRRAGHPVELAFGMGRPRDALVGHCWLVRDGAPFLERDDPRALYVEMYRIPETSR